jgi:hypothetical protein
MAVSSGTGMGATRPGGTSGCTCKGEMDSVWVHCFHLVSMLSGVFPKGHCHFGKLSLGHNPPTPSPAQGHRTQAHTMQGAGWVASLSVPSRSRKRGDEKHACKMQELAP